MTDRKIATIEDDFESFDLMGVEDIDAPSHEDDLTVDSSLIPTQTEPCPNRLCSAEAACIYEVSVGTEFRQCLDGCGVYALVE